MTTAAVIETTTESARKVRCHRIIRKTGNRCQNEALDPLDDDPTCAACLARAVRQYTRLTGSKLSIIGGRS